jgi:hypothetical protein
MRLVEAFDPSYADALRQAFREAVQARKATQLMVSANYLLPSNPASLKTLTQALERAQADEIAALDAYITYLRTASERLVPRWPTNLPP